MLSWIWLYEKHQFSRVLKTDIPVLCEVRWLDFLSKIGYWFSDCAFLFPDTGLVLQPRISVGSCQFPEGWCSWHIPGHLSNGPNWDEYILVSRGLQLHPLNMCPRPPSFCYYSEPHQLISKYSPLYSHVKFHILKIHFLFYTLQTVFLEIFKLLSSLVFLVW